MSVRKETYIIFGFKFDEEFTNKFFKNEFFDEIQFQKGYNSSKPYFITDGMNGEYTFFGYIRQLSNGFDSFDDEIIELDSYFDSMNLIKEFRKHYSDVVLNTPPKMFYVPHFV